jgi:hypothetical protein
LTSLPVASSVEDWMNESSARRCSGMMVAA